MFVVLVLIKDNFISEADDPVLAKYRFYPLQQEMQGLWSQNEAGK